jgi:phosphoglycerate dehydrogenase-like enzyme
MPNNHDKRIFTIWCNTKLTESAQRELEAAIPPHRLILSAQRAGNLVAGGPDPSLAQADIAFGQPDPKQMIELANLRWIHLSSAGYTRYDRPDVRKAITDRGAIMTNSSSVFNEPCAQHALAFLLAHARQLHASAANQLGQRAWPAGELRRRSTLLNGETVLILGFGAIARRLVELLAPLRMKVIAVRQKPRGDEPIPVFPSTELERLLPTADHVMNILPSSPATDGSFKREQFAAMKRSAVFYNIGRGTTVDQEALLDALRSGTIAAAFLDVTNPEPLPPEHPLWTIPNCHITPHTAGGHAGEFEETARHFLTNLKRYENGEALRDRVF